MYVEREIAEAGRRTTSDPSESNPNPSPNPGVLNVVLSKKQSHRG